MNPRPQLPSRRLPVRCLVALIVPVLLLGAACGSDDSSSDTSVTVADPWVRQPAEGQPAAAAYGVITNDSDATVTLIGATTDLTETVEIHETLMGDDGAMSMQEKDGGYVISAGESLVLEPGGAHIMLLDIGGVEFPDTVEITWLFADGSSDPVEVSVEAELRAIDADMAPDGTTMDVSG